MNPNHFALILLEFVLVIGLSLFGRAVAKALEQPVVFGELLVGLVCSTLVRFGGGSFVGVAHDLSLFAELGIVLLMFHIGLDTNVKDLIANGPQAMKVAAVGVIAPLGLGLLTSYFLISNGGFTTHLFVATALCATSVGLTARLFADMRRLGSPEAQLVLTAAVFDDVLGLILLTLSAGLAAQGEVALIPVLKIVGLAVVFFGVLGWFGETLVGAVMQNVEFLEPPGRRLLIPLALCFFLSWLANQIGLATIVGAFMAGLILKDEHFQTDGPSVRSEIESLATLFAPVFFVVLGLQVDLFSLAKGNVLMLTICLTIAAVLGKMACSLVVGDKIDGVIVGVGMIPRGEVGLIFASLGRSLEILDDDVFSAIVLTIVITTLAAPAALRWALARETMPEPPPPRD